LIISGKNTFNNKEYALFLHFLYVTFKKKVGIYFMSNVAFSDKKIIYIEDQTQNIYILHADSNYKTQIGVMDSSYFVELGDKQLDEYYSYADHLRNITLSLNEFKSIFKSFIKLSYSEKFMQVVLHHMVYTEAKGWKLEHSYRDESDGINRIDMIYQISASIPCKEHQTLMMVENKNFNSQYDDESKILSDAEVQLEKYAKDKMTYEVNSFKFDETTILGQIFIYDADYFFNNPSLIENIPYYVLNNNEYFKSYSYTYSYNKNNGFRVHKSTQKNTMDVLFIVSEHYDKELETHTVNAYPRELQKVNRSSNPRELDRMKSVQLAVEMVDNMIDDIDKGIPYIPTHYTQQKQIHVFEKFYSSKLKNKMSKCIYGPGLSLSNGQHSVESYSTADDFIFNRNISQYRHKDYNQLREKIEILKDKISYNCIKIETITSKFILQSKIVPASSRQEEKSLAVASNKTVGEVDTNTILMTPLNIRINEDFWNYKKLHPTVDKVIQINIPRIVSPGNTFNIPYHLIIQLLQLKEKNFFQIFRSNGGKKAGLLLLQNLFGNTEDARRYKRLIQRKSDILNILEDDIMTNEEIGQLEQEKNQILTELREFDFYDIKNLNSKRYDLFFDDLIIFNTILNMTQELNLVVPNDTKYTTQKLSFGTLHNYSKTNINIDITDENLLRRIIIYSNIIVHGLKINKNSIFNSKKHTIVIETLFECLDNSQQLNYEDMKIEFISKLENNLNEQENNNV